MQKSTTFTCSNSTAFPLSCNIFQLHLNNSIGNTLKNISSTSANANWGRHFQTTKDRQTLHTIAMFVGKLMELCAKFGDFWVNIHGEISCQSWQLLTIFFNFPIVHWKGGKQPIQIVATRPHKWFHIGDKALWMWRKRRRLKYTCTVFKPNTLIWRFLLNLAETKGNGWD